MVRVPTPAMVAVWPAVKLPVTPAMVKLDTLRLLSTSESLLSTLPVAGVSSATVLLSAVRTDASSAGVTSAKVNAPVSVAVPSVTV
ncbi:hypothetical protein D9M68_981370 [compost metagenome]